VAAVPYNNTIYLFDQEGGRTLIELGNMHPEPLPSVPEAPTGSPASRAAIPPMTSPATKPAGFPVTISIGALAIPAVIEIFRKKEVWREHFHVRG
jgi:hypothetical protein